MKVPLNIQIRETSDLGKPIVVSSPDSEGAMIYENIARTVLRKLQEQRVSSNQSPSITLSH